MLRWRLLLGTIFIATIVGLCWLDYHSTMPGVWFLPLALVLCVLASKELLWMFAGRNLQAQPRVVVAGNLAIMIATFVPILMGRFAPTPCSLLAFLSMVLLAFTIEIVQYRQPGAVVERIALTIFALIYVGVLLSIVTQLRFVIDPKTGMTALASLIAVVKLADIGAYTIGRLFGRRKLTPVLSPGKTVVGAVGGLAFACLGAVLTLRVLPSALDQPMMTWWMVILYGLVVGTVGMVGDLAESLIKRDFGKKDSSNWMPGFGGVLDLIDSILFAAPVAYALWYWFAQTLPNATSL